MKKILLLTPSISVGGSERVLFNVADLFIDSGYEVHCVFCKEAKMEMIPPKKLILHRSFLPKKINIRFLTLKIVKNYVVKLDKEHEFSIIISNFTTRKKLFSDKLDKKIHYYLHFDYGAILDKDKKTKQEKLSLSKKVIGYYNNHNVIAVSQGAANALVDNFKVTPKSLTTIYNFFDFEKIRMLSKEENNDIPKDPYIIHVGRCDIGCKRHDLLIEAYKKMQSKVKLVFLTNPNEELIRLIESSGVSDRIIIPGFQSNPFSWVKNARLLVLCSDNEALPTTLIEALICGTPVVSTDCPSGPREILTGEFSKWLVPCGDAELLAEKIELSLRSKIIIPDALLEKFSQETALASFNKLISDCESSR